ncbi:d-aspartate oxidase [Nephila pilipes]|uniref:D-aspartate oxidase n=1 Tax=Nephila pilipes TaxID=299642 RepID=A0A8X6PCR6_NEPPI|nr:d-aspartate oxidase [Nephila pilipes]
MDLKGKDIAVLGAGIVGLSTALSLQEEFPMANITVFADKFNEETLSSGAGGIFRPDINVHGDEERVRTWCKDSLSHFMDIIKSSNSSQAGIQLISGYHLSSLFPYLENKLVEDILPDWRNLNEKDLKLFPVEFKGGQFYTSPVVDCRYYLPWMKTKFEENGGKIIKKHIFTFEEIPDIYCMIVNCTGLGAKSLLQDNMLVPIRGQTIKVKAPWIKHFYYSDDVYIIPGVDYVTLGGVKDYGSWNMKVNKYQQEFIRNTSIELIPSLKNAEVLYDWVGLRPFRPNVRVDAAFVPHHDSYRLIVNNYGHGGHGVALSWGTAQEAKRIVKKILMKQDFPLSKL